MLLEPIANDAGERQRQVAEYDPKKMARREVAPFLLTICTNMLKFNYND